MNTSPYLAIPRRLPRQKGAKVPRRSPKPMASEMATPSSDQNEISTSPTNKKQ